MINITFDKRLELIYGLQYAIKKKYNLPLYWIEETNREYDEKFLEIYDKGITKEFEEYMLNNGLDSYERCVEIALSLDENYNIISNSKIDSIKNYNKNFNERLLSKYLKEFVLRSNYEDFFKSNQITYNELIMKFNTALNTYIEFDKKIITDFFDCTLENIEIKLLNFSGGSCGIIDNNNDVVYVEGIRSISDTEFVFNNRIILTLIHECSHPYVNPLSFKYFKDINLDNLLNNAIDNGLEECYHNKLYLINETMVRAISIYLVIKYMEDDYVERYITRQENVGYIYIKPLIKLFDKKNQYSTFEEFYKNEFVPFIIKMNSK